MHMDFVIQMQSFGQFLLTVANKVNVTTIKAMDVPGYSVSPTQKNCTTGKSLELLTVTMPVKSMMSKQQ